MIYLGKKRLIKKVVPEFINKVRKENTKKYQQRTCAYDVVLYISKMGPKYELYDMTHITIYQQQEQK